MNRLVSIAGLLIALLVGGAPAFAETEGPDGWKVMSPVQLEEAAAAALPAAGQTGGGAGLAQPRDAVAQAPAAQAPEPQAPTAQEPPPREARPEGPAYLAEDQPFQLKDYEEPKPQTQTPWWQTLLGFVFKLAIVISLIFASLMLVKKLSGGQLPMGLQLNPKGRNLVVLESTQLGPQQAMHLVSVGGERLIVVGTGPQGLSTLATIDDPNQVRLLLAATNQKGQNTAFGQMYDMESVVQEDGGEMFQGPLRDMGRRGGWGS